MREDLVGLGAIIVVTGFFIGFTGGLYYLGILTSFLFIIGAIVLFLGFILPALEPASQQKAGYPEPHPVPCPECGRPTTWIHPYRRYYCHSCKKYP
jgi:uncharacterized membrane protein